MQIVIAWATETKLVPTGRTITRDMNYFPEFKTDWEGHAAMWLRKGEEKDIAKAEAYAASEGHKVYTFPSTENDPLGKARTMAERAYRSITNS